MTFPRRYWSGPPREVARSVRCAVGGTVSGVGERRGVGSTGRGLPMCGENGPVVPAANRGRGLAAMLDGTQQPREDALERAGEDMATSIRTSVSLRQACVISM